MKKKTKIVLYAAVFLIVFLISALVRIMLLGSAPSRLLTVPWNEAMGTVLADQPYPNDNGNTYDLYLPAGLDQGEAQKLILFIHGGSFNSGSKADGETYCRYYASKGYITASVDYTLQTKGVEATIDIMDQEILSAVTAIDEQLTGMGYHLSGMAPFGVSAGGTLAMNLAYSGKSSVPVKFVFQLAAPAWFDPSDWGLLIRVDHLDSEEAFFRMMTGEEMTDENRQEAIARISPAGRVSTNPVPSLIGYGLIDHCVPLDQKEILMAAYDEAGVSYDYIAFPHSNHGMYNDLDKLQEFIDLSLEYAEKYL